MAGLFVDYPLIKAEDGQLQPASTNFEVGINLRIDAKTDTAAATTFIVISFRL